MALDARTMERAPDLGRVGNLYLEWRLEELRALEGAQHPLRAPGRMFATLGDFVFEVVGALHELEGTEEYTFAEHKAIEGTPRLQYTGPALQERTLGFTLHAEFCAPGPSLARLREVARRHEAVPLAWASGSVEGVFVVTRLRWQVHETDSEGRPVRVTGQVSLLEWWDPTAAGGATTEGVAVGDAALADARQPDASRPAVTDARTLTAPQILRSGG